MQNEEAILNSHDCQKLHMRLFLTLVWKVFIERENAKGIDMESTKKNIPRHAMYKNYTAAVVVHCECQSLLVRNSGFDTSLDFLGGNRIKI